MYIYFYWKTPFVLRLVFFSCWILYDVYIVILFWCCRVDLWLAGCCRCWPSVGQAARPWPVCEPKGKVLDFCLLIYNTFFSDLFRPSPIRTSSGPILQNSNLHVSVWHSNFYLWKCAAAVGSNWIERLIFLRRWPPTLSRICTSHLALFKLNSVLFEEPENFFWWKFSFKFCQNDRIKLKRNFPDCESIGRDSFFFVKAYDAVTSQLSLYPSLL